MQLDLFAAPPPPPTVLPPDPLVERLIAGGLTPNEYLLDINRALSFPPAMDLPSRLFQWPIEFVDRSRRADGKSALLLRHPALAGMPFVDEVEARCGTRPVWQEVDEFGRERLTRYQYFHAVDLLTDEHWQDFLATRWFADEWSTIVGLSFHATYGGLNTANMRAVMLAIGEAEPAGHSVEYLVSNAVRVTTALQGKFVGLEERTPTAIWACIHGLEAKKFKRDKSGFLRFTPGFLAEKESQEARA